MTEENKAPAWISPADWERGLGSAGLDWLVGTANQLHNNVGFQFRQTALYVWCVGKVLRREKELVGHGKWIDHCRRCHPGISQDTIERYMMVGETPVDKLQGMLDMTPRQVYLMLGLVKKRPSLPSHPARQDEGKANSAHTRNLVVSSWKRALLSCPYCDGAIELNNNGACLIASRAQPVGFQRRLTGHG